MARPRSNAALALGIFAGGFAAGVAAMVWLAPEIIETEGLHLIRLSILWVAGAATSLAIVWNAHP